MWVTNSASIKQFDFNDSADEHPVAIEWVLESSNFDEFQ